jgi:hypothetical protein
MAYYPCLAPQTHLLFETLEKTTRDINLRPHNRATLYTLPKSTTDRSYRAHMTANVTSAIITVGIPIPSPTPRAILSLRSRVLEPFVLVKLVVGDGFGEVNSALAVTNKIGEDIDVLTNGVDVLVKELAADDIDERVDAVDTAVSIGIVVTGVPALISNAS